MEVEKWTLKDRFNNNHFLVKNLPMDAQEILQLTDELVFASTGKHLDDMQKTVLQGVCRGQKYFDIGEENGFSEGHVRNTASKLFQILSEGLGESVSRANFRSVMERRQSLIVSSNTVSHVGNDFIISNVSVCGNKASVVPKKERSPSNSEQQLYEDLGTAPDVIKLRDRANELATLEKWILQESCRLVAILGVGGIGKTSLAIHLLQKIKRNFEVVIWRSLGTSPAWENTLKSLIKALFYPIEIEGNPSGDEQLLQLIATLRKKRCLIVLDDVQALLSEKELAGNYQLERLNYSRLFRAIAETPHKSCLIINSWEAPQEIIAITEEQSPVRLLPLQGLDKSAQEILRAKKLLDESNWEKLIENYQGNPLWLKIVANSIKEIFCGRVGLFLKYEQFYLGEELEKILQQHWQRLSAIEQQVLIGLCSGVESVSISGLLTDNQISSPELFKALQSLGQRFLIETCLEEEEAFLKVLPTLKQYVLSLVGENK
jgi:hypothetical protein